MKRNKGIKYEADDENPEWTQEDFALSKSASEVLPPELLAVLPKRMPGQRGKQVAPLKESVTIRLDTDLLNAFKAQGRGWQTRINSALKEWARAHRM